MNKSSPVKPALQMEGEASPTPLSLLHPGRAVDVSTLPHDCPWSLWEQSHLTLEKRGGGAFIPESSGIERCSHTALPAAPQTRQTHSHRCICCSLCLENSFPQTFTQPLPLLPAGGLCSRVSADRHPLPLALLNELPPSSYSLTPCPILFPFKGLITTWKYNNGCSTLTGYLQRPG